MLLDEENQLVVIHRVYSFYSIKWGLLVNLWRSYVNCLWGNHKTTSQLGLSATVGFFETALLLKVSAALSGTKRPAVGLRSIPVSELLILPFILIMIY